MHRRLHKILGISCLSLTLLASSGRVVLGQSIDEDLPLPRWEKDAPAVPRNEEPGSQFNSLLPSDPFANDHFELPASGPRLSDAPPTLMPGYSELGPMDLSLFLHGSILQSADQSAVMHRPTPVMDLRDVPSELLKGLTDAPANEYLMDPQNLTPEVTRIDLERLLEFHAKESLIHFYLLVLDTNQKLPDSAALDDLAHGALTRQKACLAVYPLGEPWRARIFLSPTIHGSVTSAMLTELAADCIQDAHQAQLSSQQLQRYAVRLSTRLFWLEKSLPAVSAAPSTTSLQEVAASASPAILSHLLTTWALPLSIGGALLFLIALALILRARRSAPAMVEPTHVWILPDIEVIPRLGGAFSGGTSALISFKS
jgi:hypothetical protein